MCCWINSVNAGEAAMIHRRVHCKHLGLRSDLGYRGLSTASTDFGYGGLSTASTDFRYDSSSTASTDLGYGGSLTASTDLGYGGSSTAATSTHSTSHLVERYQKISMHPHAEGELRYARTGLSRTVDLVVCMCRNLPEPNKAELRGR